LRELCIIHQSTPFPRLCLEYINPPPFPFSPSLFILTSAIHKHIHLTTKPTTTATSTKMKFSTALILILGSTVSLVSSKSSDDGDARAKRSAAPANTAELTCYQALPPHVPHVVARTFCAGRRDELNQPKTTKLVRRKEKNSD
jgi:hypothetical protein